MDRSSRTKTKSTAPWVATLLLLIAPTACKSQQGGFPGEDTECSDQSDCAPFHLVCVAPPGFEEGEAARGLCMKRIPSGSCAYYVREGQAAEKFCAQ